MRTIICYNHFIKFILVEPVDVNDLSFLMAIIIVISTTITVITHQLMILPLVFFLLFVLILISIRFGMFEVTTKHLLGIGLANLITITREVALIGLIIFVNHIPYLLFTMFTTFFLISDMVDGEVARSRDETSELGSILDIEADASYNIMMTMLMISNSLLPYWMIIVATIRYSYVILLRIIPIEKKPERRSKIAIAVSISYNVALSFLWSLPFTLFQNITTIFGILIIVSFIRDFYYRIS